MANPGYADIIGAIQGQQQGELTQQLTRQQIADYQALAGYRQAQQQQLELEMAGTRAAQARQAQAADIWKRTQSGMPGMQPAPAPAGTGVPGAAPAPAAGGAPGAAPMAGAAPAAPGAPQDPMAVMQGLINQRTNYIQGLYSGGLVGEADAAMKDLVPTMQHLATANKEVVQMQGAQIKNADDGLKFVQTVSLAVKDKPSFERFKMQMLQSGAPLNPMQAQLINLPYEQAKPFIDDWAKTSKVSLENQRLQAQIAQDRAQAYSANMRVKVEQLQLDRDKQVTEDYKSYVANSKLAGTPDTKILSKTEWQEGLKHPSKTVGEIDSARGITKMGMIESQKVRSRVDAAGNLQLSSAMIDKMQLPSGGTFAGMMSQPGTTTVDAARNLLFRKGADAQQLATSITQVTDANAMAQLDIGGGRQTEAFIKKEQEATRALSGYPVAVKVYQEWLKSQRIVNHLKNMEVPDKFMADNRDEYRDYFEDRSKGLEQILKKGGVINSEGQITFKGAKSDVMKKGVEKRSKTGTESVDVGGKTYTRPANMTDDQWTAYKSAMGVK